MNYRYLFATTLIILIFVSSCSKRSASIPSSGDSSEKSLKSDGTQAELWTCPMHPQVRKDGPGQCPICGMNLVRLEKSSTETTRLRQGPDGRAALELSPEKIQMIGLKAGRVQRKPLFKTIEAAGRVAFDPELYTAQNEYVEAMRQLERVQESSVSEVKHSASRMVESAKLRLKVLGLSDKQIARLKGKDSTGESLLIASPGEKHWVYAEIYESELPNVRPDLEVKIRGSSLGEAELQGRVASVDRVINPSTRTAKIRVLVSQVPTMLRPEAYVDVTILSPLGEQTTIPSDAIFDTGRQAWVFVLKDGGRIEPRLVQIRHRAGDEVAIASGVELGEQIVTSANFLIDSESQLKSVLQAVTNGEGTASTPECPKGQVWHPEMKHCMSNPTGETK